MFVTPQSSRRITLLSMPVGTTGWVLGSVSVAAICHRKLHHQMRQDTKQTCVLYAFLFYRSLT